VREFVLVVIEIFELAVLQPGQQDWNFVGVQLANGLGFLPSVFSLHRLINIVLQSTDQILNLTSPLDISPNMYASTGLIEH
jgi:hypothetical protein